MPLSCNEIRHRAITFSKDPLAMPAPLLKAHQQLDSAGDKLSPPRKAELDAALPARQKCEKRIGIHPPLSAIVSGLNL